MGFWEKNVVFGRWLSGLSAGHLRRTSDSEHHIASGRPMICRLPADYKESVNFKGHGPTPASDRCPADLYTIGCRLMSPHIRLARFPIFEVCNRHARSDQKSPDYVWQFYVLFFLRIFLLISNVIHGTEETERLVFDSMCLSTESWIKDVIRSWRWVRNDSDRNDLHVLIFRTASMSFQLETQNISIRNTNISTWNSQFSTWNSNISARHSNISTRNSKFSTRNSKILTRNSKFSTRNSKISTRSSKFWVK